MDAGINSCIDPGPGMNCCTGGGGMSSGTTIGVGAIEGAIYDE
jgi:hypothetical protein